MRGDEELAASSRIWRELHSYANATGALPGTDVLRWFMDRTSILGVARRKAASGTLSGGRAQPGANYPTPPSEEKR